MAVDSGQCGQRVDNRIGAHTAYIHTDLPWENGYFESINATFRNELLNDEIFCSLKYAQIVMDEWRKH